MNRIKQRDVVGKTMWCIKTHWEYICIKFTDSSYIIYEGNVDQLGDACIEESDLIPEWLLDHFELRDTTI